VRNPRVNNLRDKEIPILLVDDESTDRTFGIAKHVGADVVVNHSTKSGVSMANKAAVSYGANITCTTDADRQFYPMMALELLGIGSSSHDM